MRIPTEQLKISIFKGMKLIKLCFFLCLLSSCGLSTKEELVLSKAVGDYVDAVKDNQVLVKLGLSHPRVVKYYTEQGADTVKKYFDLKQGGIKNYVRKEVKSIDGTQLITYTYEYNNSPNYFYALRKKGQENWLFVEQRDTFLFPELFKN